jgi:hypothetical protein
MFNWFKKQSPADKLRKKYKQLMEESYRLSKVNRSESDAKMAEAQALLKQIDELEK